MAESFYGLLAEFDGPERLKEAARRAAESGFRHLDAFTPFPVEGLFEAMRFRPTRLPFLVLAGGLVGAAGGYLLQWWVSVVAYPVNIGGRPFHSWPSFIPATFECAILTAGLVGAFSMFYLNGLPRLNHPLFNAPDFLGATSDRFFLCIERGNESFDKSRVERLLRDWGATSVIEVNDE